MKRRNGYSDFAIPLKTLRTRQAEAMRDNKTMSHEDLISYSVKKILIGEKLFEQYRDEFLGYIATNSLNMAKGDVAAAGIDPITNLPPREPSRPEPRPQPKPEPKPRRDPKDVERDLAAADAVIMEAYFTALAGLTLAQYIAHEERGSVRAKAARALIGKGTYSLSDRINKLTASDRRAIYGAR